MFAGFEIFGRNWCEFTLATILKPVSCSFQYLTAPLRLHNTPHLTDTVSYSSPAFAHLSPLIFHFLPCTRKPHHYLSAAVTSLSSSGLKGICPSVPTSSSDEGSGVKKGRSREGPITVQLQSHSATRRLTDLGQRRWTERKREMTPPNPHLSCYWSIVLAGFVLFGTSPPSALI